MVCPCHGPLLPKQGCGGEEPILLNYVILAALVVVHKVQSLDFNKMLLWELSWFSTYLNQYGVRHSLGLLKINQFPDEVVDDFRRPGDNENLNELPQIGFSEQPFLDFSHLWNYFKFVNIAIDFEAIFS